jgi:predicted methyltransferase
MEIIPMKLALVEGRGCGMRSVLGRAGFLLFLAACAAANGQQPRVDYESVVSAADRSEADRKTDQRRKPAQMLEFAGVRSGMKVLDMGAGGGYSTELLARAVGPTGVVYAQDASDANERAQAAFNARAKGPAMKNVVRVLRNYEDPVPPGVSDLDLITYFFEYHEAPNMKIDRLKMDRRLFEALKPGGVVVVADHSARPGEGIGATSSMHRIEDSVVRRDFEAAGFRLADEGEFLRNPQDKRDVIVFKSPVPVDDFVLKFEKPRRP